MSSLCKSAVVLILLISAGGAKPVATTLGAGINLFDFLDQLGGDSSRKSTRDMLSQLSSRTIFVEPVIYKWDRAKKEEGDKFQLILCDTIQDLSRALDDNFKIAGLGGTVVEGGSNIGLPTKYLEPGYSYLLVRYSRVRHAEKLRAASSLTREAEDAVRRMGKGDANSVLSFFKKYGTHFISSYTTGESVFQVYVYQDEMYRRIKLRLKRAETLNPTSLESLFSRYPFDYASPLKTSSENILRGSSSTFSSPFLIFRYLETLKSRRLAYQFSQDLERSETLLTVNLKSMDRAITDPEGKRRFKEVLDNQIQLYETNL